MINLQDRESYGLGKRGCFQTLVGETMGNWQSLGQKVQTNWVCAQVQIIHFDRVFHYKPSILGYPYGRKHPYIENLDVLEKWLRSHAMRSSKSISSRVQGASSCLLLAMVEPEETKIGGTLGLEREAIRNQHVFFWGDCDYYLHSWQ